MIEGKTDVGPGGLQHVAVAVRQDRQLVSPGSERIERRDDIRKRRKFLDLADEPANLVLRIGNAAAVHDVGDGAMADLPVRRMSAIAQRIDHRVLEVRAAPPGDEAVRLAMPPFAFQEGRHGLGEPLLHVDDGPVQVERQRLDLALQHARSFHRSLPGSESWLAEVRPSLATPNRTRSAAGGLPISPAGHFKPC